VVALNDETGAVLWSYGPTGNDRDSYDADWPAYANGVVYAAGTHMHALDADTGTSIWTSSVSFYAHISGPTVVGSSVYIGTAGANPSITAFDITNGAQRWSHPVNNPVESTVAVGNGLVYGGTYAPSADTTGEFSALAATTGDEVWNFSPAQASWTGSPALANGVVYDQGVAGLEARDSSTGSLLKSFTTGCPGGSPAISNGSVFIACNMSLNAYAIPR
jgi:outer membrane protein assembly factor BamB